MTSIKLKFRAHTENSGALYFLVIRGRSVRQVSAGLHIRPCDWDRQNQCLVQDPSLQLLREQLLWERSRLERSARQLEQSGLPFGPGDVIRHYKTAPADRNSVFEYIRCQAERMEKLGRPRTGESYRQTLSSFRRFRHGVDLYFDRLDADMAAQYESHMRNCRLSRNTTSFYLRILRSIYNRAVEEGLATQADPFRRVYTGVDKTAKRAISLAEIRRLKELDLGGDAALDYARDLFLFSFYLRGISFVDLAYLRKKDLQNGYLTYIRKKTGQQLRIRWERPMQAILDKYAENPTPYLLPVITQDGNERRQYLNKLLYVNRKLKRLAALAHIGIPLSTYVSRHSWASIARAKNVPLSVISEGMGHDNEETTRIYLAAIQTRRIDEANHRILKDL